MTFSCGGILYMADVFAVFMFTSIVCMCVDGQTVLCAYQETSNCSFFVENGLVTKGLELGKL